MADNTVRYFKMARLIALAHCLTGSLLIICGGVGRAYGEFWVERMSFSMWCGAWMWITGILGVPGSSRERRSYSQCRAGVYMGFAITSAVFGGVTIICYSIAIANYSYWYVLTNQSEKTVAAFILVLGIIEFTIGIWAAILGCMTGTCNCCGVPSNQPISGVIVQGGSAGYVNLAQGPDEGPVGMLVQEAGGVRNFPDGQPQGIPMVQTSGQPQGYQVSTTGGFGGQLQMVPGHMQATQMVMTSTPGMQMQMDHGAEGGHVPPPHIGEDPVFLWSRETRTTNTSHQMMVFTKP